MLKDLASASWDLDYRRASLRVAGSIGGFLGSKAAAPGALEAEREAAQAEEPAAARVEALEVV